MIKFLFVNELRVRSNFCTWRYFWPSHSYSLIYVAYTGERRKGYVEKGGTGEKNKLFCARRAR